MWNCEGNPILYAISEDKTVCNVTLLFLSEVILISRILHYKFVTENAPIRTHPKLEARKESKVFDKTVEI